MIKRFSSKREDLFPAVLQKALKDAKSYDRIAGYFSSSIMDIAAEDLEQVEGQVRMVCNSDLNREDILTAEMADTKMHTEWCAANSYMVPDENRYRKLFELLCSGKLRVKVLPRENFGLAHAKSGVVWKKDGSAVTFVGSANETLNGWKNNYELVWTDNSNEAAEWTEEEFEQLWNDPCAVDLAKCVVRDISRRAERREIPTIEKWKEEEAEPGPAVVESKVFNEGFGLWEHQKYFADLVFRNHKYKGGARFLLADQVGLGKTAELAVSAMLIALYDDLPVVIFVPKNIREQWQNELYDMLGIPSAIWRDGKWFDELGNSFNNDITHCPRRIGLISHGILTNGSRKAQATREKLLSKRYGCVICDEAHKARRRNYNKPMAAPDKNNMYDFLYEIAAKTKTMILASATPVQLADVEAYDLMNILNNGNNSVLGMTGSMWRQYSNIPLSMSFVAGTQTIEEENLYWEWMRNPLPFADESFKEGDGQLFIELREETKMEEKQIRCLVNYNDLNSSAYCDVQDLMEKNYLHVYNPYVRHIVKRTREALEEKINPDTGKPYLKKIEAILFGENEEQALTLEGNLFLAYEKAEEFCQMLTHRDGKKAGRGFFETLLLQRIGSSMRAGYCTVQRMIEGQEVESDDEEDRKKIVFSYEERVILNELRDILKNSIDIGNTDDPKYARIVDVLDNGIEFDDGKRTKPWHELGSILFSQYYDTAEWIALNLSKHYPDEIVGLYAGGNRSCCFANGNTLPKNRDEIKQMANSGEIRVLVGTDAASEGLNLQKRLSTQVNIDLPWNPTKLEQRKGRVQRIGQPEDQVYLLNMRYQGSVEDKVHKMLSSRLETIYKLFGQLPDVLSDVWVDVAMKNEEEAEKRINLIPEKHPFEIQYEIEQVVPVDWENCEKVLNEQSIKEKLKKSW